MNQAFVSWSGGKDCCQAAYKAAGERYELKYLLNMINPEVERSFSHGISTRWIKMQSEALGIPIIQQHTDGKNYETQFIAALKKMRAEGITHGVFGDIDFQPHREWIENVCRPAGIEYLLPLWQGDQKQIALDFINQGFETVIIATQADKLGPEFLGRIFDKAFLSEIVAMGNISPCGEAGEYHTMVVNGPLFKQKIVIDESVKIKRDNHWFLDIKSCRLTDKKNS
ncbi:MAG TPA: diphthine--ammonia ligase [Dehalococcoidales bacterium]|nr:diphthine--ammonia ligase [Dehalococcoidales bacterium]